MKLIKKILAVLTMGVALPVSAASYVYDDSATIASTYLWNEIAPTPTAQGNCSTSASTGTFIKNNNNTTTNINIGFSFSFGGTSYSSLLVNSNGLVQFGTTAISGANTNVSLNATTAGFIGLFPLWTDFVPPSSMTYVASQAACSGFYYKTIGTSPNKVFILEFNAIPQKNTANAYSTMQLQLYETSNFIVMRYKNVYLQGSKTTTGIIVNNTTNPKDLIEYSYNTASEPANKTVLYRPANYLDHYEIEFSPDNTGLTCNPKTVKVRACTSGTTPCVNSTDQAAISATLNLSSTLGTWNGTASNTQALTFTGTGSTTLNSTTAGTATVSISSSSPSSFGGLKCYSGSTLLGSCTNTFNSTGLVFNWGTNPQTSTYDGVVNAGANSGVIQLKAVQACTGTFNQNSTANVSMNISYSDPITGTKITQITPTNSSGVGATSYNVGTTNTTVPLTFDSTGTAYFIMKYLDAGKITLSATLASPAANGKANLISKPYTLKAYNSVSDVVCSSGTVLNSNTTTKFCRASEDFTTKIRAFAIDGVTPLPNFGKESALTGVIVYGSLKSPSGGTSGNIESSYTGATAALSTGVDVGKNYTCAGTDCYLLSTLDWNEVGEIYVTPIISGDNYFGSGAMAVRTALPVGRFYPASFNLNSASLINRSGLTCSTTPTYNYMGEQFSALINLSAQNIDGFNVQNYNGSTLNTGSWNIAAMSGTTNLGSRIGVSASTGTWSAGSSNISLGLTFNRNTTPDGPYNNLTLGFAPTDADGVKLDSYDLDTNGDTVADATTLGTSSFYFGRMKINNATGSELLKMAIPVEVQYFNGTGFVTNTIDSCTSLSSANFSTNTFTQNLTSNEVSFTYPTQFINGKQTIIMNKPSGGDGVYNGSFNLTYNLTADSKNYLLGKWTSSTYTENPIAKIILSRQASKSRLFFSKDAY
jgi:MSHA biogenesis protein MshQ